MYLVEQQSLLNLLIIVLNKI